MWRFTCRTLAARGHLAGSVTPIDNKSITKGNFKVPNLRNGMLTGPYIHDGEVFDVAPGGAVLRPGGEFPQHQL